MKKQLLGVMTTFIACAAFADVLLWQVPGNSISGQDIYGNPQTIGTDDYAWDYAMLKYVDSSDNWGIDAAAGGTAVTTTKWSDDGSTFAGGRVDSSFDGETVYSTFTEGKNYYIALYNSDNKLVGYSSLLEDVSQFRAASENIASWAGVNTATGGSWTAAPEPTSGVLLLLGAAVLGLRRRKVA